MTETDDLVARYRRDPVAFARWVFGTQNPEQWQLDLLEKLARGESVIVTGRLQPTRKQVLDALERMMPKGND